MNEWTEFVLSLIGWGIVAVLGAVVSYFGFSVYRRHRERSMGFLASGFVALSVASAVTWFGLYFVGMDLIDCELGTTIAMALGFGLILYGLTSRPG